MVWEDRFNYVCGHVHMNAVVYGGALGAGVIGTYKPVDMGAEN